jgi:hypothetical protein
MSIPKHVSKDNYIFGVGSLPSDNIQKVINHHYEKEHNYKINQAQIDFQNKVNEQTRKRK